MSSIQIQDLARNQALDKRAMSVVRGGASFGPDINVNVSLAQQFTQFQQIGVNVLNNNGVIGAGGGFAGADFGKAASQWTQNHGAASAL
ncbi:MAG: hypothetical protein JWR65_2994 [Massilia sp.]|jgi:hypothetical protein|nr:hypothetical protein [Massilia sp.]